jgi:acyl carrier protein
MFVEKCALRARPDSETAVDISEAEILAIFESETSVDASRLVPSATLESLDIASLDLIGVSFEIEDKFGLVLDADSFSGCATLGDAVAMIQAAGRAKAAGGEAL